jgi:dTDP-glucose 4,6-dehydratase
MKILITGAEGFIGSHLTEALVKKNHSVKCLTLYNSFNNWGWLDTFPKDVRKELEVIPGDVRDKELITRAMKNIDVVFNLAALIGIPYSYKAPRSYVDTNINGILNILNAARELNTKQVIHISTSEVYGSAQFIPITENHPIIGQSPYSASKIGADQMAISYYKSFNLPVTIIRPFNTFGPRQSSRAVIPTIITQILKNKPIKLGSISPTRDFTFVEDTVAGMISSIKNKKSIGQVINIGSGYEISINKLYLTISKLMGKKLKLLTSKTRVRPKNSEVMRLCASIKKAEKILKWKPKYKDLKGLEKGLIKTIKWFEYKDNLKRYKTDIYNY